MKKTFNINIRIACDDWDGFRAACASCGTTSSTVIRDLCKATVPYISQYCSDGRWRAPELIDTAEIARMKEALHVVTEMVRPLFADMARSGIKTPEAQRPEFQYPSQKSQLRKVAEKKEKSKP